MPAILQNIVKFNLLAASGFAITAALFLLMHSLIQQEFASPDPSSRRAIANIAIPELQIEVIRQPPRPEKIEMVEIPDMVPIDPIDIAGPGSGGVHIGNTEVVIDGEFESSLFNVDTNAMPLVQVQPVYPNRAAQQGIEGYVVVEFDVNEKGAVVNPRVLYAEPEGHFEAASFRALERYRYQPKVVNGKEVKMLGIQQKFTFTLDE